MTVITVTKDPERCSMTLIAEYSATAAQVWELWANPHLLERWWGPPTYPATVTAHELAAGGLVRYFMTGPEGDRFHGGWRVVSAEAPSRLEFEDFFADEDGAEDAELPRTRTVVFIEDAGPGSTRMILESHFPSAEAMPKLLEMGMEEGLKQAVGQTEALLAERPS
jgi:uncharacterized protein YndB with AHSA1/START domain